MKSEKPTQSSTTLHLYGGEELLRQLKDGRIPLQTDWSFLQPFLSFAQWHGEKQQPVSEQEVLAGLERHYQQLPDNIRMLLSFEDFLQQREKLEPQIRQSISRQRQSSVQGYAPERFDKAAYLRLFSSALQSWCWQQQAMGFSGLCLGLNGSATALTARKGYPVLLKPVRYGREHQVQYSRENPLPGAFMDVESAAARSEWRLVLPRSDDAVPTIKLSKGDVNAIYLSTEASDALVEAVRQLVSYDLRYRQCQLMRVVPDVAHWKLTAVALDPV